MDDFKIDYLIGQYLKYKFDKTVYKCVQSVHSLDKVDYVLENVKTYERKNVSSWIIKNEFDMLGENKQVIDTLYGN